MREAIERVIQKISEIYDEETTDEDIVEETEFRPDYKNFPITPERYEEVPVPGACKRVAAVDGGNLEVLGAAKMSVQLNRVAYTMYRDRQREFGSFVPTRIEFLTVTHPGVWQGKLHYFTHVYPTDPAQAPLLPTDQDLVIDAKALIAQSGGFRPQLDRVASLARRFAEWRVVRRVIENELAPGDIILMDGTLAANNPNEGAFGREALAAADRGNVILTALAKSSRALTAAGTPLVYAATKIAANLPYARWVVQVAESSGQQHFASIFITKLHPRAASPYRFEIYKNIYDLLSDAERLDVFAQVAHLSRDISFAGYPYGLMVADHEARVRFQEIEPYKLPVSLWRKWSSSQI